MQQNLEDKVQNIEDWLNSTLTYTLNLCFPNSLTVMMNFIADFYMAKQFSKRKTSWHRLVSAQFPIIYLYTLLLTYWCENLK